MIKAVEREPDFGVLYALLAKEEYFGFRFNNYLNRLGVDVAKFVQLTSGFNETKIKLLLQLGDAYFDAGKYDEAVEVYKKILPLTENSRYIFTASRRIERARFFKKLKI